MSSPFPDIRGNYAEEVTISLGSAQTDKEYRIGGTNILMIKATGQVYIRFNEPDNGLLDLNQCYNIFTPFYRFFLTWSAQVGASVTLVVGNRNSFTATGIPPSAGGLSNAPQFATTVIVGAVTMTLADTEYSIALPANCKKFQVHIRDDSAAYRLAFITGKVAAPTSPYINVLLAGYYYEDSIMLISSSIYCASSVAGKIIELIAWS